MAFLDFIIRRQTQQAPAQTPPEQKSNVPTTPTARLLYEEREAWEKANPKPLSPEVKAQADRVVATLDKGAFHLQSQSAGLPSQVGAHSEPMRQKALNQDKVAPALSPTTEHIGTVAEKNSPAPPKGPAPNDPKSDSPSRNRSGWER